jgi:hypothetical protein
MKEIDLNELHAFMKKALKEPIFYTDFIKQVTNKFGGNSGNSGYFIRRIVCKTNDFFIIPTKRITIISPMEKKSEAIVKFCKISSFAGGEKGLGNIKKRERKIHRNIQLLVKQCKSLTDISKELNIGRNSVSFHHLNHCQCYKKNSYKKKEK